MIKYLALIVVFFLAKSVLACSPIRMDPTIQEDWYRVQDYIGAELIFRGKVIKTRTIIENEEDYKLEWQYSTVDVYEDLKGKAPIELITKSMISCCMCGQELAPGKEYIFYVKEGSDGAYIFTSAIIETKDADLYLEVIDKIRSGSINPESATKRSFIKVNLPPNDIHNK